MTVNTTKSSKLIVLTASIALIAGAFAISPLVVSEAEASKASVNNSIKVNVGSNNKGGGRSVSLGRNKNKRNNHKHNDHKNNNHKNNNHKNHKNHKGNNNHKENKPKKSIPALKPIVRNIKIIRPVVVNPAPVVIHHAPQPSVQNTVVENNNNNNNNNQNNNNVSVNPVISNFISNSVRR